MATDRIDELKSVQFPTERRGGYDRRAVDAYLAELADWLEAGGGDEARRSVIQREMSRVGERTGAVLAVAQESADKLTAEAEAAAASLRADAERDAGETRTAADDYAAKTRTAADEQAKATTEAADEQAQATTEAAAQQAEAVEAAADERLRKAESEAAAKTRGIEQEIADLVRKRRDVVANLEQLNAEMKLAIDGPGEKDLGLSERVEAAVDEPELLEPEAEPETEVVGAEPARCMGRSPARSWAEPGPRRHRPRCRRSSAPRSSRRASRSRPTSRSSRRAGRARAAAPVGRFGRSADRGPEAHRAALTARPGSVVSYPR